MHRIADNPVPSDISGRSDLAGGPVLAARPVTLLPSAVRIEWATAALVLLIFGGFAALTYGWTYLPLPVVVIAGSWLIAWHGSLQHELIHNHPTPWRRVNDAIGFVPLSLWLPYRIYRDTHLEHHIDHHLTDPIEDPESAYFTRRAWEAMGPVGRVLAGFNLTLLGRLTIGPLVMLAAFLSQEWMLVWKGEGHRRRIWALHLVGVCAVLWWVVVVCQMPLWLYGLGFLYGGASLSRLRSYAEHRYADHHDERTAIVENSRIFGLLFLFNNLHVLHHRHPSIPWYRLPAVYRDRRDDLIRINKGLVYDGYLDVARRFLLRAHDMAVHPAEQRFRG